MVAGERRVVADGAGFVDTARSTLCCAVHATAFEKLQSAVCVRDEAGLSKFTHGEVVLGTDVMFNLCECWALL